jgi:hypothetical protein
MKNKIAFLLVIASLSLSAGCSTMSKNNTDSGISAASTLKQPCKFSIKNVEPKNPPQIIHAEYMPTSEKDIFTTSDMIAEIEILNSKEIYAESKFDESFTNKLYFTIYTAKIKKPFYTKSEDKKADTITFCSSQTSYEFFDQGIDLLKGQEYIVFLSKVKEDPKFKFTDIAPYSLPDPINNVIIKKDGNYIFNSIYDSFSSGANSKEEKINKFKTLNMKSKNGKDFLGELNKTIKKHGLN